jgi:hypothetical protein
MYAENLHSKIAMKTLITLLLLIGILACHKDEITPLPNLGPVLEATGTLSDYSAVDGCGLRFLVERSSGGTDEYAVSDSSDTVVKKYVVYTNGVADLKATVRFQQTGHKKNVLCGFAGFKPFDEIVILSINPR